MVLLFLQYQSTLIQFVATFSNLLFNLPYTVKKNLDICPARAGLPLSVQIDLDLYPGGQLSRYIWTAVLYLDRCPVRSGRLSARIEIQIYLDGQWQSGSSRTNVRIFFYSAPPPLKTTKVEHIFYLITFYSLTIRENTDQLYSTQTSICFSSEIVSSFHILC